MNQCKNYYMAMLTGLFCFVILAMCYTYGTHAGLNSRITAGVELDASSINVALSRMWFHLHEGYIGYRQINTALFQVLVPDNNPNNFDNFKLLSDPAVIQQAFDNVRKIIPATLSNYSFLSPGFAYILMEDIGLSDYYTLSFLLFGVHPTSMYCLYFLLLASSIAIFIAEFRNQFYPLFLLALVISIFPIFFFSDFFIVTMPSVNANRFISTLGFIPITYVLCMILKPAVALNRMQILRLVCQALLFAFALSVRRTAQWQLIALLAFSMYVFATVFWPYRKSLFQLERLRLLMHPLLSASIIFTLVVFSYQAIQQKMMNPVYQTDHATRGHAVWHSAYLGLSLHPDWQRLQANTDAANDVGDGIAFNLSARYLKNIGIDSVSHVTNTYMLGLHEIIIKQEFVKFIKDHKRFVLELYGYYKPKAIVTVFWNRITSIFMPCLLYFIFCGMMFGVALSVYAPGKTLFHPEKWLAVATIFLLFSCLPSEFAYPKMDNGDDLWMLMIFICLGISIMTYLLINYSMGHRMRKSLSRHHE